MSLVTHLLVAPWSAICAYVTAAYIVPGSYLLFFRMINRMPPTVVNQFVVYTLGYGVPLGVGARIQFSLVDSLENQ